MIEKINLSIIKYFDKSINKANNKLKPIAHCNKKEKQLLNPKINGKIDDIYNVNTLNHTTHLNLDSHSY
jgi:hypothetical protein